MNIEQEIKKIKTRNKKVELDKRWETSWTRRLCICALTFLVVFAYNWAVATLSNIFFNSIVPVLGFLLSTLSVDGVRRLWEKKYNPTGGLCRYRD